MPFIFAAKEQKKANKARAATFSKTIMSAGKLIEEIASAIDAISQRADSSRGGQVNRNKQNNAT